MEFFNKAKVVRLKSHLGKYLVADDDGENIRQGHNGSSRKARWVVEFVEGNFHLIRLKSCHGKYLAASDEPFLLGMTGKKVIQTIPSTKKDASVEWEPIKEGDLVRLRAKGAKFLRANGATPPWRNSITHDLPHRSATQDWVLWEVNVVDLPSMVDSSEYITSCDSSFSSLPDYDDDDGDTISHTRSMPVKADFSSITNENRWLSMPTRQSGMEVFEKAKSVRLQSHHGKYLVANDDEETVTQTRNGSSHNARWTVELVEGKRHVIRLKSCHGLYLTATDDAHLLSMTGKKVCQTLAIKKMETSIEWEPIKEGIYLKFRTNDGKFLRGNAATPPWRNSITHDVPHRTSTQSWILWGVDIMDIVNVSDSESFTSSLSPTSSFNSWPDDYSASPGPGLLSIQGLERSGNASLERSNNLGMEYFRVAKTVRLRSYHDKYLFADSDQEDVIQDRNGTAKNARWSVEFVEGFDNVIRLKSCYGKYLTATDEQMLLGVTGHKVQQIMPQKLDSSIEWEPIRDDFKVRLKTRYGNFLRANGGLPPLRNSVSHDIPQRHKDWVLWQVDIVEARPRAPKKVPRPAVEEDEDSSTFNFVTPGFDRIESLQSLDSPRKSEGRIVYYRVVDDDGNLDDAVEEASFQFKGHGVEELTQKLEEVTGVEDIIVCSRNPLNGQLFPLRLSLPPNNATMHVVVVPATSQMAENFPPETPR